MITAVVAPEICTSIDMFNSLVSTRVNNLTDQISLWPLLLYMWRLLIGSLGQLLGSAQLCLPMWIHMPFPVTKIYMLWLATPSRECLDELLYMVIDTKSMPVASGKESNKTIQNAPNSTENLWEQVIPKWAPHWNLIGCCNCRLGIWSNMGNTTSSWPQFSKHFIYKGTDKGYETEKCKDQANGRI